MNEDLQALTSFSGIARLFPLPNVVLFPQVMLPLHIFETRYRQMTADALAGDRLIGMVLLQPGWEADYEGKPALWPVGCLGRITAEQRLDDGRYNLLLRGLGRMRIVEELKHDRLYRIARVELLRDVGLPAEAQLDDLRRQLAQQAGRWFKALGAGAEQLGKLITSDLALGALSDVLAFALPLGMELKQELLGELAVERRVRRLVAHLETADIPGPSEPPDRSFPPDFSPN
jgi:Lon protease-like protein